jgi:hypothetical protein
MASAVKVLRIRLNAIVYRFPFRQQHALDPDLGMQHNWDTS